LRRSFLKERGGSRPPFLVVLAVVRSSWCWLGRAEIGVGVKARAEPDRTAAVGP
jgi:hypothetical protein